ncbi:PIG-L deacetylase family protein [Candidatus Leptofilum sp.]|uniref:PIG-L deacetylase family protein n=1 Tax=Candidatus Leptofilum sp. TaxID=3241576 RepID=UPI003B597EBB
MPQELRNFDAFADVKRLIVIAAHPDDLETICGGTVYQLAQRGVAIFSVNCTLGDIGTNDAKYNRSMLAAARLEETVAAARVLGIAQTFNLGRPDGELLPDLALRADIARLYRLTQADTLFTFDPHWTGQMHPDHRAAGQAALDAYMPSKMPLYRPEQLNKAGTALGCLKRVFVFSTDRDPDAVVDVTAVYPHKIAATIAHKSQFPDGEANLDWMKELDKKPGEKIGVTYAEQFKQITVW